MKSRFNLYLAISAIMIIGYILLPVINVHPLVISLVILAFALSVKIPKGLLRTAIDVSDLTDALGDYYRDNRDTIFSKLMVGMDIDDRFTTLEGVTDELPLVNLQTSNMVQPGTDKDFNPTADTLTPGSRILKVRDWKVDLKILPTILHKTWLAKYKKKGSDVYQMLLEEFIFSEIIKQCNQEIRLSALYKGVYDADGDSAADIFDGIDTILKAERTAGNLTAVVTGALAQNTIIDQVYSVYDALDEAYKAVPTIMPVAPSVFDWFVRKDKALYGQNTNQEAMKRMAVQLDGTLCTLLREPGKAGSEFLAVYRPDAAKFGVDSLADGNNILIEKEKRYLNILIDAKAGVEMDFVDDDCVACNDRN